LETKKKKRFSTTRKDFKRGELDCAVKKEELRIPIVGEDGEKFGWVTYWTEGKKPPQKGKKGQSGRGYFRSKEAKSS